MFKPNACLLAMTVLSAVVTAPTTPALAAETASSRLMSDCMGDARRLCAQVSPGGGRIADCLQKNESLLSAICKAQIATISTCREELQKLCGTGNAAQTRDCARSKSEQFSATCRAVIPQ